MFETSFTKLIGLRYPVIQAGMAGGITTPDLVASVSNAGGLGQLGAGYLAPDQLRSAIRRIKELTTAPFGVNLFIPQEYTVQAEDVVRMNRRLDEMRAVLGVHQQPPSERYAESFADQMQVVLDEGVALFSFTFGVLDASFVEALHSQGTIVMGTATTVMEAQRLENSGVDVVVAQGSEAGGHRGTFLTNANEALIGTMALVPQVVDHVSVPVVASGGIMDGRGLVASLSLGATAVQMGTAFVTCSESGAHERYKHRILTASEDATAVTLAYSGKAARGIRTEFMHKLEDYRDTIPPYPVQNTLTRDIRQAAAKQDNDEYMSLWAGQGVRLATKRTAAAVVRDTIAEAEAVMCRLSNR